MDVDSIEIGLDFAEELERTLANCKVMIVVIGRSWLTVTDEQGRRRLDSPTDWVRMEVSQALARGIRVIPVVIDGARMPTQGELPDDISALASRNAHFMSHARFGTDGIELMSTVERILEESFMVSRLNEVRNILQNGGSLARSDLILLNLTTLDLAGVDMSGANLVRANLSGVDLAGTNLERANLEGATLDGARLHGTRLSRANLWYASLRDVKGLSEAKLDEANFYHVDLSGVDVEALPADTTVSFESYERFFAYYAQSGLSSESLVDEFPWAAHPYPGYSL